jgi:hypothetical protein
VPVQFGDDEIPAIACVFPAVDKDEVGQCHVAESFRSAVHES